MARERSRYWKWDRDTDALTPTDISGLIQSEGQDRHVAETELEGDVRVSTVFLGIDHGYGAVPILFETMIFGGEHDQAQERYATAAEARTGHLDMVRLAGNPREKGK